MDSPLYRLEQEFERVGLKLTRQTMSNWLLHAAEDWLNPIYNVLHQQLCQHQVLHGDETTLQVLREKDKAATRKSYMWLYRTSGDAEHPIVLYEYQPNRKAEHAERFLKGFSGLLHANGYQGYHKLLSQIREVVPYGTVVCRVANRRTICQASVAGRACSGGFVGMGK